MSGVSTGLTVSKAINISEKLSRSLVRSTVINGSQTKRLDRDRRPSDVSRAELICLANVRMRTLLTTRNVQTQEDLIQEPREVMETKNQEKQISLNQTLSKINDKVTSLFSKKNFLAQGTPQIQNSTTISNPTLVNQNHYPLTGNIAASTDTNTAISIQAGETQAESAINIISLHSPDSSELAKALTGAFHQSIQTLNKMSDKFAQRPINASLL